ncbi:hypothetical protein PPERSA_04862 [Pseudocohnilembus persalinus]|uniref:Transmembrane protein n=1 Tax=Pseudocohnilembus persalinus TaxID=266149 RepID=A0A0V0QJR5_PSEPJ|nr:hypothetical protein PPERSA_04862 [Pseudocohnilembus persalinus]|eukprot:KRX02240.1 hypothetical protein PPERSA_04862 [Pseudocohnilembus persalinus]
MILIKIRKNLQLYIKYNNNILYNFQIYQLTYNIQQFLKNLKKLFNILFYNYSFQFIFLIFVCLFYNLISYLILSLFKSQIFFVPKNIFIHFSSTEQIIIIIIFRHKIH